MCPHASSNSRPRQKLQPRARGIEASSEDGRPPKGGRLAMFAALPSLNHQPIRSYPHLAGVPACTDSWNETLLRRLFGFAVVGGLVLLLVAMLIVEDVLPR